MMPSAVVHPRSKKARNRLKPPGADEYVPVIPLRIQDESDDPVQISRGRRAKNVKASNQNLTAASTLGYRSIQSNRGAHEGTWYFEVNIDHMGQTGHCRLGVGTINQELEAPCGYTDASMAYRDVDGSKVHRAWREAYGVPFKEGDVIGVWLHLPEGGRRMEPSPEIVRWKGRLFQTVVEETTPADQLTGSALGFSVNGIWQGIAFENLLEGTYYATASLFTKPSATSPATVTFNFGPAFKFPPPVVSSYPAARPFSAVPLPPPTQPPTANDAVIEETDGMPGVSYSIPSRVDTVAQSMSTDDCGDEAAEPRAVQKGAQALGSGMGKAQTNMDSNIDRTVSVGKAKRVEGIDQDLVDAICLEAAATP